MITSHLIVRDGGKLISGNVGEPLNQMQKEIVRNCECGLMQHHHHQKGQVSCHGSGPGGLGGVNSISSLKKLIPQTLYSMVNEFHGGKTYFR